MRAALALGLCLGLAATVRAENSHGLLRVLGEQGNLRLYRFETEAWPIEVGATLPDNARVELDSGALLRLRYRNVLDLALAGPARFAVYELPTPDGSPAGRRVVLKLDQGSLFVDGRFQFGRPADIVLGLPDRDLPLTPGQRFFVRADSGASVFYVPISASAGELAEAHVQGGRVRAIVPQVAVPTGVRSPLPLALLAEPGRPVSLFVVARDFNQDLGMWPRPAVLGPLLAERMSLVPGIRVVDGSGDTRFSYRANSALKKGQDDFLKALAQAQGARWVLVGNCVADTPPQRSATGKRWVRGQAEVRLLDAEGDPGGLALVNEAAVTRVARAGRPIEQAARQAFEAASAEVSRYMQSQVEDLLRGRQHTDVLIRLEANGVGASALEALRARLNALDSVQRVFRRSYAGHTAMFDLMLRRGAADFDAQWAAAPKSGGWTFKTLPSPSPTLRRIRAEKLP